MIKLANLVLAFLKPTARQIRISIKRIFHRHQSLDDLHRYWRQPDAGNLPEDYLRDTEYRRSHFLVDLIKKYAPDRHAIILEVGCNAGRNLNSIFQSGYKSLEAIEISEQAVGLLKQAFPDMAHCLKIYNTPVEEIIRKLEDSKYDVVFTMAVFEHIHTNSEWIFPEVARITRRILITIEDEQGIGKRHFPRNYRRVFEPLGLKQIAEINLNVEEHGLGSNFVARVFQKDESSTERS